MPVWEPSDRMEDTLVPDWRFTRFSDKRFQARFVRSAIKKDRLQQYERDGAEQSRSG